MSRWALLAVLAAAPVSDRVWVGNWVSGNKVDPKLMPGFHGSYDWSSPHAADTYAAEAFKRARAVKAAAGTELDGLRSGAEATLGSKRAGDDEKKRAAQVLGWLQVPASVPALAAAAGPDNTDAIDALSHFGSAKSRAGFIVFGGMYDGQDLDPQPEPRATAALVALASSPVPRVKQHALRALVFHEGPDAEKALSAAASACELDALGWLEKHPVTDRVKLLTGCTLAPDAEARAAAVKALAGLDDRAQLPLFLKLLDDPDDAVFVAAHRALSKLEGFPGEPPTTSAHDRALLTPMWKKRLAVPH